jgi:hypothetical protein
MLKLEDLERHLWLSHQLRNARRMKPRTAALHLTAKRTKSDPERTVRETAQLMQLRLHLEAMAKAGTKNGPSSL